MKNDSAPNDASSADTHDPTAGHALNVVAGTIVEVTDQQWLAPFPQVQASQESIGDTLDSPATLRDRFLDVLDTDDRPLLKRIALDLVNSKNPLPGMTCEKLGLPPRSTYGAAARQVLAAL